MKNFSIIGSCIFLLGFIIFGTTLALCGWDFANLSTRPSFEEKRYSIANSDQTIILNDSDTSVVVEVSPDEFIHFIYSERDKEYYNIYDSDEIKIEKKKEYQWYDNIFVMDLHFPSFTILLPAQFNGDLVVKTTNAKITLGDVAADKIHLSSSNGQVHISNISTVEDVTVKTTNAKITVSNTHIQGKLKLATNNNDIYLNQISALDISAQTTNGKISADYISSAQNMSLITTNISIEIRDVFAENDIVLGTSNGKISGTIKGFMNEYSIISKTTNNKNNLPESSIGGNKRLDVSTTNAEIMIRFVN